MGGYELTYCCFITSAIGMIEDGLIICSFHSSNFFDWKWLNPTLSSSPGKLVVQRISD